MNKNHNSTIVTLDTEMYKELIAMAKTSPRYSTKRIERHARKFNPQLQPDHQKAVRDREIKRTEQIQSARKFKESYVGKVVYACVDMLGNTKGDDPALLPVKVIRIAKDRRLVDVLYINSEVDVKYKHYTAVSVDTLQLECPDDYIQGVGGYHRYLVKENGPYDIREVVKEQDRKHAEYLAQQAEKCTSEPTTAVAYDVIGER